MQIVSPRRAAVVVALLGLCSCGATGGGDASTSITVFAASSLTSAFTDLGEAFADARPDIEVTFSFAGSTELSTQIAEGAPAEVFAAADAESMAVALGGDSFDGDTARQPRIFARNEMVLAVGAGNPESITGLADLARDGLVTVLCDVSVPCGRYARSILDRAGIAVAAKSLESNVKAVVTKIVLGEADAGIVYATDITGPDIEGIGIPDSFDVIAEYPIVALSGSPAARDFVEFVMSPAGQEILVRRGFRRADR